MTYYSFSSAECIRYQLGEQGYERRSMDAAHGEGEAYRHMAIVLRDDVVDDRSERIDELLIRALLTVLQRFSSIKIANQVHRSAQHSDAEKGQGCHQNVGCRRLLDNKLVKSTRNLTNSARCPAYPGRSNAWT